MVFPPITIRVDYLGRAVVASWLEAGCRVWISACVLVELKKVQRARGGI
jgi:hypothetical protein